MTPAGSHHVTWERCPRCGWPAAVGWRAVTTPESSNAVVEYPVEFDCVTGCGLSVEELVESFPSAVTARRRSSRVPASVPGAVPSERVDALELVPGHAATAAEVWLWHGRVAELGDEPRLWVSLQADDWPMSPATAPRLAGALLTAAERAEA